jgi:hypothetical protein
MGCHCTHHNLDLEEEEEALMCESEAVLSFSKYASAKVCTDILVLTVNETLNWNRLHRLSEDLNLNILSPDAQNDPVAEFYNKLKTGEVWMSRKLCILALLLGKGSSVSKAELLFAFYDLEYNKFLTSSDVQKLSEELCDLALVDLPAFSIAFLEHQGNLDAAVLVQNYAARLQEAKSEAVKLIKTFIFDPYEDQVTLMTFKEKVTTARMHFMLTAKGLRCQAIERYKEVLREQARHRSKSRTGNTQ